MTDIPLPSMPGRSVCEFDYIIGDNIRGERAARGWSQKNLSDLLGVSFQQVQKYERGKNRVSAALLFRLAVLFARPVAYFYADRRGGEAQFYDRPLTDTDIRVLKAVRGDKGAGHWARGEGAYAYQRAVPLLIEQGYLQPRTPRLTPRASAVLRPTARRCADDGGGYDRAGYCANPKRGN
jgi:transcriptional regulator with XRE-family HTH domain